MKTSNLLLILGVGGIGYYLLKNKKPQQIVNSDTTPISETSGDVVGGSTTPISTTSGSVNNKIDTATIVNTSSPKIEAGLAPLSVLKVTPNIVQQTFLKKEGLYDTILIPKGTILSNVRIYNTYQMLGFFEVNKINNFDSGSGSVRDYQFDILEQTDTSKRTKVNKVELPYATDIFFEKNGFRVGTGDIVKIKLKEDVQRSIPNQIIMYT
jgi:hypothetical protein